MILTADAAALPLAARSVHCVVTSPPYWGLRDYGIAGQLGLEPTPEAYVEHMVRVFREVWRVLRDDGTLWLNLGDSYAGGGTIGRNDTSPEALARRAAKYGTGTGNGSAVGFHGYRPAALGLKPKDLVGIPWRVAFALQADGWWLRSDIVWAKPNPLPESVTDRPTRAHEYVFLLTKAERYYYDAEAIKEQGTPGTHITTIKSFGTQAAGRGITPSGNQIPGTKWSWGDRRNRRTVWAIATEPYPEAHFATFPTELVKPCILAGTSERGVCAWCGAPWEREVETHNPSKWAAHGDTRGFPDGRTGNAQSSRSLHRQPGGVYSTATTTGWRLTCRCEAPTMRPLVLDPFAGSGTVGQVCHALGRRFLGTDLNPTYCRLAQARTAQLGLL